MAYNIIIETKEGEPVCIFQRSRPREGHWSWLTANKESDQIKKAARDLASAHKKDMLIVVEEKSTFRREPVVLFETLGEEVLTEIDPREELENLRLTRFPKPKVEYQKSLIDFLREL